CGREYCSSSSCAGFFDYW
nr:immunoglobulin heavy chain junction region [Macaca mulatta]MOW75389.1 immunoglobulin heavy chain junction region [Macaca mulatta]MOW75698.1 immunoglobulin heavy chain junction region [Macaca mulatta]MOW75776.1 immunoglobulin heavy chain junction region [Macaca mulatta]MOW75894.1 immunoglobulin heavy chain junction region [Macaca mulatta]